ncbi:coiled-coil domain-containing [Purpureocillium lavendulum]|uniref:Coiled-coil domain-containing n=1 Tax=Purpureocillium lavendulum TaxID=1247861 RepID=A0AB34G1A6_9HYPO|nr:coiled-coil domain-containing [Purpureocillium lavendulum]
MTGNFATDRLGQKYGDDPFVRAARDPQAVRRLLSDGLPVTPAGFFAAVDSGHVDTVEVLMEAGTSPNVRSETASSSHAGVRAGWEMRDVGVSFRDEVYFLEWQEWFPLRAAARTIIPTECEEDRTRQIDMVRFLLKRGADPYELYRQALAPLEPYPFPGDEPDDQLDPPQEDLDTEFPPAQGRLYGTRTVIHSLFEDGALVRPFFDPDFPLVLEHRDPQGRTILHSACRSALGADALLDAYLLDTESRHYSRNVFVPSDDSSLSLFHALRLRGADVFAVDKNDKHILHHLLEARTPWPQNYAPPMIKGTLCYILSNLPELINTPDRHGTLPIPSALQRWSRHQTISVEDEPECLESVIELLLDAGADPLACDGRGNTALHYIAANGLALQLHSEAARRMFRKFLQLGLDVNIRNAAGRRAIEILFDDDGSLDDDRGAVYRLEWLAKRYPKLEEVHEEVLGLFDGAGVRWKEVDGQGRSLLHVVARHPTVDAEVPAEYLLDKGLDVLARAADGKTAIDVAEENGCKAMLALMRTYI